MIFGLTVSLPMIAAGGLIMLVLLFFQMASGMRWIKLPPKRRIKIHKTAGITLVTLAVLHGTLGLVLASGLRIG